MTYTAAHWGAYRVVDGGAVLAPLEGDPQPSRIGRGWLSAATDRHSRILRPAVRKGWLAGDRGAGRSGDAYVEMGWDEVLDLAASELDRVRSAFGNGAIFAGSYGWASAGRFHHAQSQLRRFLNFAGGYVAARDTYSHAAAEVMFPHLLGLTNRQFQDAVTSFSQVREHCELVLAFGGISPRTAQVASSGTSRHEVGAWLDELAAGRTPLYDMVVAVLSARGVGPGHECTESREHGFESSRPLADRRPAAVPGTRPGGTRPHDRAGPLRAYRQGPAGFRSGTGRAFLFPFA